MLQQGRWAKVCKEACFMGRCRLKQQGASLAAGLAAFYDGLIQARARAASAVELRRQLLQKQVSTGS